MHFIKIIINSILQKKLTLLYFSLHPNFNNLKLKPFKPKRFKAYKRFKTYMIKSGRYYKWYKFNLRTKITLIFKKRIYVCKLLRKRRRALKKKIKLQWKLQKLRTKIRSKFLNKLTFKRFKIKKYIKLNLKKFNKKQQINTYLINNFFCFQKYFSLKEYITVGPLLSKYNNFSMRNHDFKLINWSFENDLKSTDRPIQFKTNLKKHAKFKIRFRKKRLKFWKLRIRKRRRFRKFTPKLNKNSILFYTNTPLYLNLEKFLILILNQNNTVYSTKLILNDFYKLKNTDNPQNLYLYLNNNNKYTPNFIDTIIELSLKPTLTFFIYQHKIRPKKFFKHFFKKIVFFKKLKSLKNKHKINNKLSLPQNFQLKHKIKIKKIFKHKIKIKTIFKHKIKIKTIFNIVTEHPVTTPSVFWDDNVLLTTKHNRPFIIKNIGLFISSKLNINKINPRQKFKFRFKKKYYSFLAPNQLKKSIFLIKSKIVLARFFFKNKKKFNIFNYFKFSSKNFALSFLNFFKFKLNSTNNTIFNNFKNITTEIIYNNTLNYLGDEESDRYGEVFIPRIRFKPGYQRLWRLARTALKEALRLKYVYQYRLTRYLMRFSRKINSYFLYYSENTLERVVMYSKLLPDLNSFFFFLNNQSIYLNGRMVYNSKRIVYVNDFIQLIISQWFYAFYRWLFNWTTLRTRKFKRLVYRKGLASRYKLMKTKKQKSRYTPNWIFNVRYDLIDVRPNLEVDYFTLSVFYLYEPYLYQNYPINELSEKRHHIYRLYNWKYIT